MGANITLTGRLGRDPETRTSQKGSSFTKFTIAHSEKTRDGQENTTWFDVTAFGMNSNFASQYLHKGDMVQVIGPLSLSMYQGRDGQMRIAASVNADRIEKLANGKSGDNGNGGYQQTQYQAPARQQAPQQHPTQDYVGADPEEMAYAAPSGRDQVPF